MLRVRPDDKARADLLAGLDEICRLGACRMLAAAVQAEADAYVDAFVHEVDEQGHRLVVRNGYAKERTMMTAAGAIEVKAPRVNDRRDDETTGERRRFTSSIIPPWCRRSPKVSDVLPLMYLHGMSTGDFAPALSTQSWADVLRDLKLRGMRAPVAAVGDGALGLWAAMRDVFPETVTQRCWVHKVANVLAALPASAQPAARKALAEIRDAEDREHAVAAVGAFADVFGAKHPKAVAKITGDQDELLAFFDYPAEHWIHLKTANPIESTFATVRLRTKVTKGAGSRAAGLAMAFKLIESAQSRWRSVNAPHLVALVRAGAKFEQGVMVERPKPRDQEVAA